MSRFDELCQVLSKRYPNDPWISNYERHKDNELFIGSIKIYNNALKWLDNNSWRVLKTKAIEKFKSNHPNRGKAQFFDLLNEALAYEHLLNSGALQAEFIQETKSNKTPDIQFELYDGIFCCEVKTINNSDATIKKYRDEYFGTLDYRKIEDGLFKKLASDILRAENQINNKSYKNLIYIIINFDDITGEHLRTYQEQLIQYLNSNHCDSQIYIRGGLHKNFFIHADRENNKIEISHVGRALPDIKV